jgi:hemolysin activation/secretion protein
MSGKLANRVVEGASAFAIGAAATLLISLPVQAQVNVPNAAAPTRDELRGVTNPQSDTVQPRLKIAGGIERSPCPLADPRYADIKVTVGEVTFNNLKGATAAEMEAAWKPLAGQQQPIAVLCDIRDAAGTILRNKGYLAAVQVPTQRIENGQVRMEVLYARVTAVRARGETRGAEHKLQQYLDHLGGNEIFDRNRAERYLLLARDLPGYDVQLTLRPAGTAPGDLIGEVTVLHQPYAVDFTVQNLASRSTGRWGGQLRAQFYGLTGMGDQTTLSYYATADFHEQHVFQASHEFRPGREGLVVGGQLTYALTKPDIGQAAVPVSLDARTLFASLYGRFPLVRSQRQNLWVGGGFDLVDQNVDFFTPLTRDRLRVMWARLDADAIDMAHASPQWRMGGSLELRQGLAVLGATRPCGGLACLAGIPTSRSDGSPSATVVRGQLSYERAAGPVSLAVTPRAQYAFSPVLSFEEFSGGNYTVGRGYDPGDINGDSGVGVSVEGRGPHMRIDRSGDLRVQPYAFFDAAYAWNRGQPGSERLTSVGGGMRAELGNRFRLDAAVAVPLKRVGLQTERPDPRFLLTLTTRLLPWSAN